MLSYEQPLTISPVLPLFDMAFHTRQWKYQVHNAALSAFELDISQPPQYFMSNELDILF